MSNRQKLILHISFWVIWIAYTLMHHWLMYSRYISTSAMSQVFSALYGLLFAAMFFYFNYIYLIPTFFSRKKIYKYLSILTISSIVYIPIYSFVVSYRGYLFNGDACISSWNQFVVEGINVTLFYVFVSTGFGFIEKWYFIEVVKKQLQKEKLSKESAFLKTQVNPIFLIGILDDINELALSKSPNTADALLDLADIMRYMLYETNDEKVPLIKEIANLKTFLNLQELRFNKKVRFCFTIESLIENAYIEPMLLITMVELTSKLKVISDIEQSFNLTLNVSENELIFTIDNPLQAIDAEILSGKGLQYYQRRLLLLYPQKHTFEINQYQSRSFINLKLERV